MNLSQVHKHIERFVGLELLRFSRARNRSVRLRFWRDPDGPEVDWILDVGGTYVPIEVKWSDAPTLADTRHLRTFLAEYPTFGTAYIVCRAPTAMKLANNVTALPWQTFLANIAAVIDDHVALNADDAAA